MGRRIGLLVLALLFVSTSAFAGGSGNCLTPVNTTSEFLGVGGGFEYNYVDSRMNKMENKGGPRDMRVSKLQQVYGKLILGVTDYVNIYGKIGGSNYRLEFVDTPQEALMEIMLEDGIYTGLGINALVPVTKWKDISFGIGGDIQSNFFHNNVKGIRRGGRNAVSTVDGSFYGVDGENSLYVNCKYDIEKIETSVIPYLGAYHSWIVVGTAESLVYDVPTTGYVDNEDFQGAFDFATFGFLMGLDVDIAKYANLNIEGRMGGETALTTGATIKF